MQQQPQWKDYERFIIKLSWASYRRFSGSRVPVDYDDVLQEASMAFVKASKGFDPERGFKFITYLGAAIASRLANFKHSMDRQLVGKTISFDSMAGDEEGGDIYEVMPSREPTPLETILLEKQFAETMSSLGPLGQQMIDWIMNPPEEIQEELVGYLWKVTEMQRRGSRQNLCHIDVDVQFLFGELLPRLIPNRPGEVRRLRAKVQGAVSAWQI